MQLKVAGFVSRIACGFAAAMIILVLSAPAAADYTWDPLHNGATGDASGTWDSSANWWNGSSNVTLPNSGNFYTRFGGATAGNGAYTVTVQGNQTTGWLFFDNSGYTLTGGTITMINSPAIFFNPGGDTIASDIVGVAGGSWGMRFTYNNTPGGVLALTGTNTWTGVTELVGSTVSFGSTASLPNWNVANAFAFQGGGGTNILAVRPGDGVNGWSTAQMQTLLNVTTWSPYGSFGIDTTNGNYTLTDSSNITLPAGVGLSKVGANTMILSGATNHYSGPLDVTGGTLQVGSAAALFAGGAATVNGSGTLDLNGFNANLGSLSGYNGTVNNTAGGPATLTISAGGGYFTGMIQNTNGALSLVKSGTGSQWISERRLQRQHNRQRRRISRSSTPPRCRATSPSRRTAPCTSTRARARTALGAETSAAAAR